MIQAVIFDLDGTVLDNEEVWEQAFQNIFNRYHLAFDNLLRQPNDWVHEPGIGLAQNWFKIVGEKNKAEELARETVVQYQIAQSNEQIAVREELEEVIAGIKERGWRTALATSSTWFVIEKELEELGMILNFDITTTGDEVLLLKPDPEMYLLTAQKLEVDPENCLVVEDAIAGIRAAVDAGCKSTGLVSGYAPAKLIQAAGANYTINDFTDLKDLIKTIE